MTLQKIQTLHYITKERFKNKRFILALRQPQNLIRQLTSAKFDSTHTSQKERPLQQVQQNNCM